MCSVSLKVILTAAAILLAGTLHTLAADMPKRPPFSDKTFFSGNDVYQWCRYEKALAQTYVSGMYDMSVHGAFAIDRTRHLGAKPDNDFEVDFALEAFIGFCKPERATVEQMTDLFCAYLSSTPAKRDLSPALLLNDALKDAWPCPIKN